MSLEAMGLGPDADEAAVRTRYKELVRSAHPDAGGTAEQFQQVTQWRNQALLEVEHGQALATARVVIDKLREAARGTTCPRCQGTGNRMTVQQGFRELKFPCRMCKGRGKLS